jgi:hypothetical protein
MMSTDQSQSPVRPPYIRVVKPHPAGAYLNMWLVPLRDGSLLIHSPTYDSDATYDTVDTHGVPRLLFAPTGPHHLSLERFRERYKDAQAVAGPHAIAPLKARKHDGIKDLREYAALLPEGAEFLVVPGTRWGETWLSLPQPNGETALLVCDAFINYPQPLSGAMGALCYLMGIKQELCITRPFRWVAIRDRAAYCDWAQATLARLRPTTLLLSHGEPVSQPDLPERLAALLAAIR